MVSKWILHVKQYCKKHGCSYKEGLSRARASYKPVGGSMVGMDGHGIREPMPRVIGGGVGKSKPKNPKEEALDKMEKVIEKAQKVVRERREAPRTHGTITEADKALVKSLTGSGMPLPQLKKEVKSLGHKLSRVVDGVRKAYNKKELMSKLEGGKFSFKKLASDAGKISKKILKTAIPAAVGVGTAMETGNPAAALAAAKGSSELTNYLLGSGLRRLR
jgi:hypothetical protein